MNQIMLIYTLNCHYALGTRISKACMSGSQHGNRYKTYKMTFSPGEDSDQSVHPRNLTIVFTVLRVPKDPKFHADSED